MQEEIREIENKKNNHWLNEAKSLGYVIILALLIRILVLELFFVPTGSMNATILEGDYIFSTKYSYGYSKYSLPFSPNIFSGRILASVPKRGDIVIFRPTVNIKEDRYIKRLIGIPGDKIQLINDVIYINDQPIERQAMGKYINERGEEFVKYKETLPGGFSYIAYKADINSVLGGRASSNTEIFYVPDGKYFFMGDNRDNSKDSRFELGFVPFENFIAKGQFILFSTKESFWLDHGNIFERIARVWPWLASTRVGRIFKNLYIVD